VFPCDFCIESRIFGAIKKIGFMRSFKYPLVIFILIGFSVACHQSVHTYQYQSPQEKASTASAFLFLSFRATERQDSAALIELIDQKRINGSFKDNSIPSQSNNRLEIKLLGANQQELHSYQIDHPLLKQVEYADERNQLVAKLVRSKKEEFFLRVTLPQTAVLVQVNEIKENKKVGQTFFKLK
jgi:hypothetical protein